MLPWQPFLAFYIWGAHWRHLKNTIEPSVCGGDAVLCQITLTTCYSARSYRLQPNIGNTLGRVSTVFAGSAITPPKG